jgi:hypothetical protein
VTGGTVAALCLAAVSTTLTNLAYLQEHDSAAKLPVLSMRRPGHSARLLLGDHSWLRGFSLETGGFLLYAGALALASLALVQSIAAGGIGLLAFVSSRMTGSGLGSRRLTGVLLSTLGLLALAVSLSLSKGGTDGVHGSSVGILAWLGVTVVVACAVLTTGRRFGSAAVAQGIAGGLLFSIGDISTKLATEGGVRTAFIATLILGYLFGTSLIQMGYQHGNALTVAGMATLLTNAVQIVFGTVVLKEPVPPGIWGPLRILAYVAVSAGAILLATPDRTANQKAATAPSSPG